MFGSEIFIVIKNGRNVMKCKCDECGIIKYIFVVFKKGGVLVRRWGFLMVDKIVYVVLNFVMLVFFFIVVVKVLVG